MKKTFVILLSLFVHSAMGQITMKNNAPRPGDEIIKQQVEYKHPGREGENVIWDFSRLKEIDAEYKLTYHIPTLMGDSIYIMGKDTIHKEGISEGDLIIGVEHMTMYYYQIKDNDLLLLGHENPVILMHHTKPVKVISYPFNYADKTEKEFVSQGLYSGRENILTEGNVQIGSDAYGKMILPTGDTLNHVLRVKSVQHILEADSLKKEHKNSLHMETETYRWYAKGYRYPVFEAIRTFSIQDTARAEIFNTSFFYPPQEHYYLSDDPENLAVLDSLWREQNPNIGDPNNPGGSMNWEDNFAYNFYPNPVRDNLYIEYLLEENAEVTISIYDANGKLLKSIPKQIKSKGLYNETIECTPLIKGTYMIRINVNDKIINNKIVKF